MNLKTETEISKEIADRIRAARILHKLTQSDVSQRSGVSLASYQRFEQTGRIELLSLIKVAQVLHLEADFDPLFNKPKLMTLDEVEKKALASTRKGRVYKRA
ncbi:helix-turn-helix transcriptional regulator [Coraliomargarita sp. SDUM461004]|uniref:Helix-turn-helix transcriptional regulator n=1 Tax=Thalassobacterium sedimentorum TaxID=3041258 RepID=A0ABU1AKU0_9BACT|nr:helix-turn-helix transcriptional regulator [Coraliomargarita sp. SDUM461004]MDQ8195420.1 helix-turn-helix transcriptional regulator [Coraliomargarita sp. SDUM461004]